MSKQRNIFIAILVAGLSVCGAYYVQYHPATLALLPVTEDVFVPKGETAKAGLLEGSTTDLALNAVKDFDDGETVLPTEVTHVPLFGDVIRVQIEFQFRPNATVGEVNTLLRTINGHIVSSLAKSSFLTVRIPDPGSVLASRVLVARIKTLPFIADANIAVAFPQPANTPGQPM